MVLSTFSFFPLHGKGAPGTCSVVPEDVARFMTHLEASFGLSQYRKFYLHFSRYSIMNTLVVVLLGNRRETQGTETLGRNIGFHDEDVCGDGCPGESFRPLPTGLSYLINRVFNESIARSHHKVTQIY